MTDASPYIVPMETVVDVEDRKAWEPVSLFVTINDKQQKTENFDDKTVPKCDRRTIAEGLHPLLVSMGLFGLYFNQRSEVCGDEVDKKSRKWNARRIYAVTIVILLWVNAVRMFSVFTQQEEFGIFLFSKLINVIWSIQCAISQTAFYAASLSGRLAVVLRQPLEDTCARHARKFAVTYTAIAGSVIMAGSSMFLYHLFFTGDSSAIFLTPLQIHIATSHTLVPRILYYFFTFYLLSAHVFSQTTTFVLAMIFSHQFRKVSRTLRSRLDDNPQRHVSDADIETFRQKHQEISMNADYPSHKIDAHLGRLSSNEWTRRPNRPRNRWLDLVLWRRAVHRGHGARMTLWPSATARK